MESPQERAFLSPGRTAVLRNLLGVVLGFGALLALIGVVFAVAGDVRGGVTVLVIGAIFGALGGLSLRAVQQGAPAARRLVIATGLVVIVLSVLTIGILVGLLTVILGVGLLAVTFAPDQDAR